MQSNEGLCVLLCTNDRVSVFIRSHYRMSVLNAVTIGSVFSCVLRGVVHRGIELWRRETGHA
jgi:hypothetical protein